MERICIFCGSSPGRKPEYVTAARQTGEYLAAKNLTLVYGGGKVGMMGEVANATLTAGGRVIGVIPKNLLEMELANTDLVELADAFIALPGGFGTMEEFFEMLAWAQLGLHQKPLGLMNVCGYYDRLIAFLMQTVEEKFVDAVHYHMILVSDKVDELMEKIAAFKAVEASKSDWAIGLSKGMQ
jgi:predicted Rossmann-fold nucleotide-binding protein